MRYLSTKEIALKWNLSQRSVRNYCSNGRVIGAIYDKNGWLIPEDALKPKRELRHFIKNRTLLEVLKDEKNSKMSGGIYHKLQIEMTYNSNHIEGCRLTHVQTRYIFETKTINASDDNIKVDDIIETTNHFKCIDLVIDNASYKLNEYFIKQLHYMLKFSTTDSSKSWFKVGDYKLLDNEVGGIETCTANNVKFEMKKLLDKYNSIKNITISDIIEFHYNFQRIHPFQDGNGRVGRLVMLKECLIPNIVPIIITDESKMFYYRGLKEYKNEKGYLLDTCLCGQDIIKSYLDYFKIKY